MKKFRKLFALLLSFLLVTGMLAGCKSTSPKEPEKQSGETESVPVTAQNLDPYGTLAEKTELHIGRSEDANVKYEEGESSENNYITKYLEEKLNVDYIYDFSVSNQTYDTKVAMAITSGELPDVMTVSESQLRQLVKAGAVADMTDAYNKFASDNLKSAYDSTNGISFGSVTFDGKILAMPNVSPGADGIPLLYIRGDWMDQLGLKEPKSMDDVVNIIHTFMEKNPGGKVNNGLVVAQKIVATGGNTYGIDALFALYNSYPKFWITEDSGKLTYGSITPETKEALTNIRKLVTDGIIDPSFIVRDSDQCQELVTSGQAGVFFGAWWNMASPLKDMSANDDSVYWNCYTAPLTEDGKYNTHMMSPTTSYLVVNKDASEAIKEAVIKTMNYQFDIDQDQGVSLKPRPEAGYSWTMMPLSVLLSRFDDKEAKAQAVMDVVNGVKQESDLIGEEKLWYQDYKLVDTEGMSKAIAGNGGSGYSFTKGAYAISSNDTIINKVYGATYAHTDTMDKKWATLEKMEDEKFLQILVGDADVSEFDNFVSQWKSLGGDEITTELEGLLKQQ